MGELIKNIILMSAVGGILALFLLIVKPLTKRLFSPKWQYYIWLSVLIVMVLPIKFNLPEKSPNIISTDAIFQTANQIKPAQIEQQPVQTIAFDKVSEISNIKAPEIPIDIIKILSLIWLFIALLIFLYKLIKYIIFVRKISKNSFADFGTQNILKKLTIRKTALLDAPLIVGLINPTLYLPEYEISDSDLNYILMHELTHYKRHDLLYKWFTMLVSSIHWFNPLIYVVSKQIDEECEISCDYEECEISCDYEVCKNLSDNDKKYYMSMILEFIQTSIVKKRPLTTQMASSKTILKRRFTMIKNKKTTSKLVSVFSVMLALAMFSTTVFASGLANTLSQNQDSNIKYEVYNGDKLISFNNEPFIYNDSYYLPLRETLNAFDITDIKWNNGKINISMPDSPKEYVNSNSCEIAIGSDQVIYDNATYTINCVPILKDNITYASLFFFEDLIRVGQIPDFRFNAVRDLSPEAYYEEGEQVFIGTLEEQDNFNPDTPVKRIIVDENRNTLAVIPVENQQPEKLAQIKLDDVVNIDGYSNTFNAYIMNITANGDYIYAHSDILIYKDDKRIAYIPVSWQINIPKPDFSDLNS